MRIELARRQIARADRRLEVLLLRQAAISIRATIKPHADRFIGRGMIAARLFHRDLEPCQHVEIDGQLIRVGKSREGVRLALRMKRERSQHEQQRRAACPHHVGLPWVEGEEHTATPHVVGAYISDLIWLVANTGGRGGIRTHEGTRVPCRFSRPVPSTARPPFRNALPMVQPRGPCKPLPSRAIRGGAAKMPRKRQTDGGTNSLPRPRTGNVR